MMSPSPVSSHRFWPERWATATRDRLGFLRLLTLLLALLTLYGAIAVFGFRYEARAPLITAVAAVLLLSSLWIAGYRRACMPIGFLPVELALVWGATFGIHDDFAAFGVMFVGLQHRVLYGSRGNATILAIGYAVLLVALQFGLPPEFRHPPGVIVLQLAVGAFGAYLMHTMGEVLVRDRERKNRLHRSEERYRAMFDNNPWPMWLYDPTTLAIVDVNASAVDSYGYTRAEFLGMTIYDVRPPSERHALEDIIASAASGQRATHLVRHLRKNGDVFDVEVTGEAVELDGRPLRLAIGVDVSPRERAERALRESEARFRSVANCLREALVITDLDDRIVLVNDAVRDVLGHEPDAMIGKEATALLLPQGQRNAIRERTRHRLEGRSELYEIEMLRADGSTIVAEVSASPYRDLNGEIVGTLGAISDVTERKRLEERVRQGSRLEAVGQLAGGVAHDFNNLLTVIKVHAELLREDIAPEDILQGNVREIERAADRAAEVTGQLLAFSRRQHLQPREVDLGRATRDTLPVLRKLAGSQFEISLRTDVDAATVFADPTQLENVLVTLVRNACEAMPDGGGIDIATTVRALEAQDLSLQNQQLPAGTYAVLTVTDSGSGMDAAVQRRLFEPFFTTKEVGAGSGLGLSAMFGVVRQSGGYVDVQSAPGIGTTFVIYLPLAGVQADQDAAASIPALAV